MKRKITEDEINAMSKGEYPPSDCDTEETITELAQMVLHLRRENANLHDALSPILSVHICADQSPLTQARECMRAVVDSLAIYRKIV